jgi:nucleoside-diphosphate-sugar epimerase
MKLQNKRILITGATGLIGSNLVDKLMQSGNNHLFVTGRNQEKLAKTFCEYTNNPLFTIVEHDAADPIPPSIKDVDYIFHAAGPMERDVVMYKPASVIKPNILGVINCLEYLRKQEQITGRNGRLIVFSSVTVYANTANEDYTVNELDTTNAIELDQPYACYAESKRMSEVIAKSYFRQYGVDAVIARFSTVYGFTRNIPKTAFFEFINKALAGETITLNSSGFARRDNIYIDDAIEGLVAIAERGSSGESYNISSNGEGNNFVAIDEIANIIAAEVSKINGLAPVEVKMNGDAEPRESGIKLDNSKLKSLGWSLETQSNLGINKTIKLIKALVNGNISEHSDISSTNI